jgi:hypothetical protein
MPIPTPTQAPGSKFWPRGRLVDRVFAGSLLLEYLLLRSTKSYLLAQFGGEAGRIGPASYAQAYDAVFPFFLVAVLLYFWVGVRFLEDFMPSLVLLSIVGFWQGHGALARRSLARRAYLVVGVSLGLISVLTSSLLALSVSPARLPLMRLFGLQ